MGQLVSLYLPVGGCECLAEVFWLAAGRGKSERMGREHPALGPVLCTWIVC